MDFKTILIGGAVLYFFGHDIVSFVHNIIDTAVGTAKSTIGGITGGAGQITSPQELALFNQLMQKLQTDPNSAIQVANFGNAIAIGDKDTAAQILLNLPPDIRNLIITSIDQTTSPQANVGSIGSGGNLAQAYATGVLDTTQIQQDVIKFLSDLEKTLGIPHDILVQAQQEIQTDPSINLKLKTIGTLIASGDSNTATQLMLQLPPATQTVFTRVFQLQASLIPSVQGNVGSISSGGDLASCITSCTNNFVGDVTSGIHIPSIHIGSGSGQCTSMSCNNGVCTTSHECNITNTNSQSKSDIRNAEAKAYLSQRFRTGDHAMNRMTLL